MREPGSQAFPDCAVRARARLHPGYTLMASHAQPAEDGAHDQLHQQQPVAASIAYSFRPAMVQTSFH